MTRTPRVADHRKRPVRPTRSRVTSGLSRIGAHLHGRTLAYLGAGLAIAGAGVVTVTAGFSGSAPAAADALSVGNTVAPLTAKQYQVPAVRPDGHAATRARPTMTQRKSHARPAAPVVHRKAVVHLKAVVHRKAVVHEAIVVHKHRAHVRPACQGVGVSLWTCEAFRVLAAHREQGNLLDAGAVAIIAQGESGGNPAAVNNWDSNAAAGTPSTGLMQTIGPTFQQYCLPGHCGSMVNPVDDIIAATRYADARYGGLASVPGVQAVRAGGSYIGY